MKQSRLFVLCNIKRDYEFIQRVVEGAIVIINEIFDKESTS